MGIPILTTMTGGPNQTIMVQRVPLLETIEPLNAPYIARPIKVVGDPQSGHSSAILEIVGSVLQRTGSGATI